MDTVGRAELSDRMHTHTHAHTDTHMHTDRQTHTHVIDVIFNVFTLN